MRTIAALLLVLPAGCDTVKEASLPDDDLGWGSPVDLGVDPSQVVEYRHDFGTHDLAPAEELADLCLSWTLDNEEELFVGAVELRNGGFWHHSNWLFVPESHYPGPDGIWPCAERQFHEVDAALNGGVLYAQSTQVKEELQRFPAGAAVRIPPRARVIGSVHMLNFTLEAQRTQLRMRILSVPRETVEVELVPFRLAFGELRIPPRSVSRFVGECDVASVYGGRFDLKVYYLLPHTHDLGFDVTVQILGGPRDGEVLHRTAANDHEANGKTFDEPADLTGARGFRFWCGYNNPRDAEVRWGLGDQEMCEVLGYADSRILFDAWASQPRDETRTRRVEEGSEEHERLARHVPTDGAIFTADCSILAIER